MAAAGEAAAPRLGFRKTRQDTPMKTLARLAAALLLAGLARPAEAKVTRLEIAAKQPYQPVEKAVGQPRWSGAMLTAMDAV